MIYKTTSLSLDGAAVADTHSVHNRPPLAQTFRLANGERFSVVVNHFKSKGSCPAAGDADAAGNTDAGDGQGCWNALRTQQAQRLQAFVAGLQADRQDDDVLVIGDLNAYGKEDPILSFLNAGYTDLIERFHGQGGYSYVFDGEAGYLDHALATPTAAAKATGTTHWHINADEPFVIDYDMDFKRSPVTGACYSSTATSCSPDLYTATPYRSSDHDPIVLGLDLSKSIVGTRAADTLVGTAGDDVIWGGEGSDALTTGAGRDVIVFKSAREGIDTVTDFAPGTDRIDVRTLAAELRSASGSANLFASGHLVLVDTTAGVQLRVDGDGFSGRAVARPLVTLRGVSASQIDVARDLLQ
jgi:Ca2+-binding RTX toxin-like protein